MRRTLLLIALLSVVGGLIPLAGANHPSGYHWRRGSNPFTVDLINAATGVWTEHVDRAANRWSKKSAVLDFDVRSGSGCGAVTGKVKVCSGSFPGSWAGLAEMGLSGNHIVWATVKLDDSARSAARAVACHELGHTIGLDHRPQSESSSCLTPSVSPAQKRPDAHDLKQLKRIYRHADGPGAKTADIRIVRIYTYL